VPRIRLVLFKQQNIFKKNKEKEKEKAMSPGFSYCCFQTLYVKSIALCARVRTASREEEEGEQERRRGEEMEERRGMVGKWEGGRGRIPQQH
jgi:hypothetical protein